MSVPVTILIPDISGYTDFMNRTELDHSAHIVNELLELIVNSNNSGFYLSEIEGDALLFYKKGEPLAWPGLVRQCLDMFENFHKQLKIIERDTVCQCGACQSATNLNLKFILHYGIIKELRVANFVTASGVDMIIAHRLLKNSIDSDEYILATNVCKEYAQKTNKAVKLEWKADVENYPSLGRVEYQYTLLEIIKNAIPPAPKRESFVTKNLEGDLELIFEKPLKDVYQHLINIDIRVNWMAGVDEINRDMISERIGMKHNCLFMGMTMENTAMFANYSEEKATYIERVEIAEMNLDVLDYYLLTQIKEYKTKLKFTIDWGDTVLSQEMKKGIFDGIMTNLELLKAYCEAN